MDYAPLVGTIAIIHILALISPGPDFIMACKNSLIYSRKIGIWTAVGFGLGIAIHILYSFAGLALIISQSVVIFTTIKLLGAAYLLYIGIKSFLSKSSKMIITQNHQKKTISPFSAIRIGFLTNILNPKASLFFLSVFTLVIPQKTPLLIMGIITIIMVVSTMVWFSLVAIFLTQRKIYLVFKKFQDVFTKIFGGLLIIVAIKIALLKR